MRLEVKQSFTPSSLLFYIVLALLTNAIKQGEKKAQGLKEKKASLVLDDTIT